MGEQKLKDDEFIQHENKFSFVLNAKIDNYEKNKSNQEEEITKLKNCYLDNISKNDKKELEHKKLLSEHSRLEKL